MMKLVEQAHLILYRVAHQGLEVFLVKNDPENDNWSLPESLPAVNVDSLQQSTDLIELEPVADEAGQHCSGLAVQGDWHDIPSLKALLAKDAIYLQGKVNDLLPGIERNGAFFLVKDAIKKVLPQQYSMLKELRDILADRNSTNH
jgi:hypothetical protein